MALAFGEFAAILLPQEQADGSMDSDMQLVFEVPCPFIDDTDVPRLLALFLKTEAEDTDLTLMQPGIPLRQFPETGFVVYGNYGELPVPGKFPECLRVLPDLIVDLLRCRKAVAAPGTGIQCLGKADLTEKADDGRGIEYLHPILVPCQEISLPEVRQGTRLFPD